MSKSLRRLHMMLMMSYAHAAPSFTGPLDSYTTNLLVGSSLARLFTAYSTNSLVAYDTTTTGLHDGIFTSGGALNSADLVAFAGGHTLGVSGFANQHTTPGISGPAGPAASNYPTIVSAGSFLGDPQWDGSSDSLQTGTMNGAGTIDAFTVYFRGKLRSTSGTQVIAEYSTNYNSNNACVVYYDAGALSIGSHRNSPSGNSRSDFSGAFPDDDVHCYRIDRTATPSAAQTVLFIDGVKQTRTGNGDAGTLPAGVFASGLRWFVGSRNHASLFAQLNMHTLLIYSGAHSDADVATISAIVAALP